MLEYLSTNDMLVDPLPKAISEDKIRKTTRKMELIQI